MTILYEYLNQPMKNKYRSKKKFFVEKFTFQNNRSKIS